MAEVFNLFLIIVPPGSQTQSSVPLGAEGGSWLDTEGGRSRDKQSDAKWRGGGVASSRTWNGAVAVWRLCSPAPALGWP